MYKFHVFKRITKGKKKTLIKMLLRVCVLFLLIALIVRAVLLSEGFCFAEGRKLSDQELADKVLLNFFHSQYDCQENDPLPLCKNYNGEFKYSGIRYLLKESSKYTSQDSLIYIPYLSIEEIKKENPDCCRLFDTFEDGVLPDGEQHSPSHYQQDIAGAQLADWTLNKYIKHGRRIMVLKVKLRYTDNSKNVAWLKRIWVTMTNCGQPYAFDGHNWVPITKSK